MLKKTAANLWQTYLSETDPLAKQIAYLQYLQALNDPDALELEARPPAMPPPLECRAA